MHAGDNAFLEAGLIDGDAVIADGEFGRGVTAVVGGNDGANQAGVQILDRDCGARDGGSGGIRDNAKNGAAEGLAVQRGAHEKNEG